MIKKFWALLKHLSKTGERQRKIERRERFVMKTNQKEEIMKSTAQLAEKKLIRKKCEKECSAFDSSGSGQNLNLCWHFESIALTRPPLLMEVSLPNQVLCVFRRRREIVEAKEKHVFGKVKNCSERK